MAILKENPKSKSTPVSSTAEAFHFWFYIILVLSFISFSGIFLRSLSPKDVNTWFLSLPDEVRDHYSKGRTIKVQMTHDRGEVEIFCLQQGTSVSDSNVLIIHGMGSSSFSFRDIVKSLAQMNVQTVAIDLPGSGFSDRSHIVVDESGEESSFLHRVWEIYEDIKTKGLFWGFDQLVEQGYVDFEETKVRPSKKEAIKPIDLDGQEVGKVLGQVIDALSLEPVDLVLHDSALAFTANWILENRGSIQSLLLLDSAPSATAFPHLLFQVPVLREFSMQFTLLFQRILASCCMKHVSKREADGHRVLLKGRDWGTTILGMGKRLNTSFDLHEWSRRDEIKGLPVHVICSGNWSDRWTSECQNITAALPDASISIHSGGRWIEEHNSQELAQHISKFISSLPKSSRLVEDSYGRKTLAGAEHDVVHHDHSFSHPGYADAYGLGHGWSM